MSTSYAETKLIQHSTNQAVKNNCEKPRPESQAKPVTKNNHNWD